MADSDNIGAILNAPDLAVRSGVRDRAMMHLCFAAGLRVSELVGVLTEDVSLQHGASVTIRGKGRKERCLPLWKDTARDLRTWRSVRGAVRVPELFVNAQDEPMTRAGFEYVLDKHVRRAAETCASLRGRSVSPHQLRHSCAGRHAAGKPRHPEGRPVAWSCRHPHDGGLSPHGPLRKAGSG
jgi:site-specific recombinase XerD